MKLAILHLSDIHLAGSDDAVLQRTREIATATFPAIRGTDACLIAVTGDISLSGAGDQYRLARQFLESIRDSIVGEGCPLVDVVTVPGNHDSQLIPENKARTIVIEGLVADNSYAEDPNCIELCVSAQANYFEFRKSVTNTTPVRDDPLWTDYEFVIAGKVVRISAINASWMSRIPESPGSLVFPTHRFQDWVAEPAALRIAMVHHPLNWYSQSSYHALRTALRTSCSVVLSGHEHVNAGGEILEFGCGRQLFFEAPALQPHIQGEKSGFSVLVFDTDEDRVSQHQFALSNVGVERGQICETNLGALLKADANAIPITKDFDRQLCDPGGGFGHPEKEHLEIDDIFVYPELRIIDSDDKSEKGYSTPAEEVLFRDDSAKKLLLLGEEKAGKTSLLFRAFKEYQARGLVPLYIAADSIASFSTNEISKTLSKAVRAQYEDSTAAEQVEREIRVCLLDDLDRVRGGAKGLLKLIREIESQFEIVVVTASQGFEIRELVNSDAAAALGAYRTYEFCRFGNTLRHRLIRKWCQLGNYSTLPELDREVHNIEAVVNAIVSRNLTPSLPIYLLILLQSCSQQQQGELQNSGFARYYEYLMTRSLVRAGGIRKDEYDELFNYLSQLAWLYREADKEEATKQELIAFTRQYSQQYFHVDLDARLGLLVNARLLNKRGECYQFAYPYVYFFFLGRYLAKNLSQPEVKERVRVWCSKLYLRKNAHAIVFLSYHSNDSWIVEQVSAILDSCFSEVRPIEFGADISAVNSLVETTTKLLVEEPNVARNQEQVRRRRDEAEKITTDDKEYPENGEVALIGKFNLLLKTAEILGQIVKNYYGSMERARKEELISKVISGPMRFVRFVLQYVGEDPDAFVIEMEKWIEVHDATLDPSERRKAAREAAFHLLRLICTGAVIRTAGWIGSERLEDDIAKVVQENQTVAFKLVEAGTRLLLPRDLALDHIRRLAKELEHNPFAFGILQSMALRHLHLFHVKTEDRQKLCSMLKIEFAASRGIDLKTKNTKLLKR